MSGPDTRPLHSPMPEAAAKIYRTQSAFVQGITRGTFQAVEAATSTNDALSVISQLAADLADQCIVQICKSKNIGRSQAAVTFALDLSMRLRQLETEARQENPDADR